MNPNEKRALISFLLLYTLSAMFLLVIIGILYYNKELVNIQNNCSMQMNNAALTVKQELMKADMEKKVYIFNPPPKKELRIGLFDANGSVVFSNLESNNVLLSQKAYQSNTHEYHVSSLDEPYQNIHYIVVANTQGVSDKNNLLILISSVFFVVLLFVACVGYLLSRMLLAPIKSRMKALNDFIKDSAHEINTPVSALMMSTAALRNHPHMPARTLNHLSISAKRIFEIFNSLSFIAFHDLEKAHNEHFDIALLVHEGVKFFEELATLRGNTFTCKLEQTTVFMDKSQALKLIHNLLSNAIKYSYEQTTIDVQLSAYILQVSNEGEGIALDDCDKIFERYTRKNTTTGGFGIGLNIVKTICDTYGIAIAVESVVNEKTTFSLDFGKTKSFQ